MKEVLLLGLGGDIGVYAFQRAAHELFGWKPMVLSKTRTTFLKHSTLATWILEPQIHDPDVLVARLNQIAQEHPDDELILITNLDWHVRALAQLRNQIDPRWHIPLCDLAAFDRVSSKTAFSRLCTELGIRTPISVAVGFVPATHNAATPLTVVSPDRVVAEIDRLGLEYPLIGKPAASADWFNVSFPGKQKIHHFESEPEVVAVLERLTEARYPSEFLIQEFVPGDETHMRSLTAYRDRKGDVTLLAGGTVLLEEHTPGTLGIPAAILTGVDDEAFSAASRFLTAANYYGFANFDYKVSSRTGDRVFFEMNPRIGRNNYYVTAAGVNVARVVAQDLLPDHVPPTSAAARDSPSVPPQEILYSVVPYRMLLRYIMDPHLRSRVKAAKRRSGLFHPLVYSGDNSFIRRAYVQALNLRLVLKFRTHYPKPTDSGF